ncbi:MAG: hypothetical protein ACLSWY_00055 [Ruthenibacterium lactatiformans]
MRWRNWWRGWKCAAPYRRGSALRAWDVTVDTVARSATKAGVPVALTPRNWTFWNSFAQPGAALYRDVLFERVWGGEMDDGTRTLDCTSSACAKLGWQEHIKTVYKVGIFWKWRESREKESAPAPGGRAQAAERRAPQAAPERRSVHWALPRS